MRAAIVTSIRFTEQPSCVEGKMCYHLGLDLAEHNRKPPNNTGLNMRLYFLCHVKSQFRAGT